MRVLIWLILPVVLLTSCNLIYDQPGTEGCSELSIAIEFPADYGAQTRSTVGEIPAESEENAIHDLAIWVFYHTNEGEHAHAKVASLLIDNTQSDDLPTAGSVRKYSLPIADKSFVRNRPKVDVFVLINRESISCNLTEDSDWNAVNGASFGGSHSLFSPNTPVTSVPGKGLPMSGVGMGLTIGGDEPFLKVPTISVVRAVSKLRFVFCQMFTENNTEEEYAIEKVVLDGRQIPMEEYVFSTEDYNIKPNNYVSDAMEVLWPDALELEACETPELYSYAGQDGPSYEQLIIDGIAKKQLSHLGTYYLRESDKALHGTVRYSVTKNNTTENKEIEFSMESPGDFARNHIWTVFGYFISNRTLQMGVSVLPWDKNNYTIEFSTASLQVTQKFTVDRNSASVVPTDVKDHYNVFLDYNRAAKGYLYVTTPQGGKLEIIPEGTTADLEAFTVTPVEATIDPSNNKGRIDISIERNRKYEGDPTGRCITLSFKAYTPDGDREIDGSSECVDQVYHFYL